jgi:hypothetical protein
LLISRCGHIQRRIEPRSAFVHLPWKAMSLQMKSEPFVFRIRPFLSGPGHPRRVLRDVLTEASRTCGFGVMAKVAVVIQCHFENGSAEIPVNVRTMKRLPFYRRRDIQVSLLHGTGDCYRCISWHFVSYATFCKNYKEFDPGDLVLKLLKPPLFRNSRSLGSQGTEFRPRGKSRGHSSPAPLTISRTSINLVITQLFYACFVLNSINCS